MMTTTQRPYLALFVLLACAGLLADQASKYGIFTYLYSEELAPLKPPHITLVPEVFQLEASYLHYGNDGLPVLHRDPGNQPLSFLRTVSGPCLPHVNRGALFGIGNGNGEHGGMNSLFALISVVAAGFIIIWACRPQVAQDRLMCTALGLILGGTLGNLYDRLVFSGVRDFLHWYYWYDWPVFNVADCCLVCGATALMLHSFLVSEQPEAPATTEFSPATAVPLQTPPSIESAFSEPPYGSAKTESTPAAPLHTTAPADGA